MADENKATTTPKQETNPTEPIIEFISEESKKSPVEVKPVKVERVEDTTAFAKAVAAALKNPQLFVNDTTLKALEEAVGLEYILKKAGEIDPNLDTSKVDTEQLKEAIKSPGKTADKQAPKLESQRKIAKATWAGNGTIGVVGGVWAKQAGLDEQSQQVMTDLGQAPQTQTMPSTQTTNGKQGNMQVHADLDPRIERNLKTLEENFGEKTKEMTLKEFQQRFGGKGNIARENYNKYKSYMNQYRSGDLGQIEDLVYDRNAKFFMQSLEMRNRAYIADQKEAMRHSIRGDAPETPLRRTEKRMGDQYRKAATIIEEYQQYEQAEDEYQQYEQAMQKIPQPKGLKRPNRMQKFARDIGRMEGMYESVQNIYDGDLLPDIVSGKFFDSKRNKTKFLIPTEMSKFQRGKDTVEFKIAKESDNEFENNYYEKMTKLYYSSPALWVKTIMSGEGFAHTAYSAEKAFDAKMKKTILNFDIKQLLSNDGESYLKKIQNMLTEDQVDLVEDFLKRDKRLKNLAFQFNGFGRARDEFFKQYNEKVGKKIRNAISTLLLQSSALKKFSSEAISAWVNTGAFSSLIDGIGKAINGVASMATSPLGTSVGKNLSSLAVDLSAKLLKPISSINLKSVGIVMGVASIIGFFVMSTNIIVNGQYSYVVPTEILTCSGTKVSGSSGHGTSGESGGSGGSGGSGVVEPFVGDPLPSDVQCILGTNAIRCTQGPFGNFSHAKVPAVDLVGADYVYAPQFCDAAKGNCVVSYTPSVNCTAGYAGGMVILKATAPNGHTYTFKMIHVAGNVTGAVGAGVAVARTMEWSETGNACSSGKHLHLEVVGTTDPMGVLTGVLSNGGFGCSISQCQ